MATQETLPWGELKGLMRLFGDLEFGREELQRLLEAGGVLKMVGNGVFPWPRELVAIMKAVIGGSITIQFSPEIRGSLVGAGFEIVRVPGGKTWESLRMVVREERLRENPTYPVERIMRGDAYSREAQVIPTFSREVAWYPSSLFVPDSFGQFNNDDHSRIVAEFSSRIRETFGGAVGAVIPTLEEMLYLGTVIETNEDQDRKRWEYKWTRVMNRSDFGSQMPVFNIAVAGFHDPRIDTVYKDGWNESVGVFCLVVPFA